MTITHEISLSPTHVFLIISVYGNSWSGGDEEICGSGGGAEENCDRVGTTSSASSIKYGNNIIRINFGIFGNFQFIASQKTIDSNTILELCS